MSPPPIGIDLLSHWQDLALAADVGDLILEEDAARFCDSACDEYLATLNALKIDAGGLGNIKGMGDFESGIALARKFSLKAVGGDNNLVDVLDSHILVVESMQNVFRKFIVRTAATDGENASSINIDGPR